MTDMRRSMPFPFPGSRFPDELGAVVQKTVLDGLEPARIVVHDGDGEWAIGDGVNDPNEPGACIATHISHVVALDDSVAALATMPPGYVAERDGPGAAWNLRPYVYEED